MTDEELTRIRREFHAHPEISEKEYQTCKRIEKYLKQFNVQDFERVAETGVLAHFDSGKEGNHILIRGDIDALPIEEENDFPHVSTNPGVSHKCGHDGHTTIILGLARQLVKKPVEKGKVTLLFQPAEETGAGARKVIKDRAFKEINPDLVFALHNLPGYPTGKIIVKEDSFSAAATSIIIRLKGKTSHAAEPENGINPALVLAKILTKSQELSNEDLDSDDFALITPVYATLGEKSYGVSAGYAEVHLTLRAWTNDSMEKLKEKVVDLVENCSEESGVKIKTRWVESFYANINAPEAVNIIREAAEENRMELEEKNYPFKWGEDFGLFTEKFTGAMFGIGAGEDKPSLHNADYDFPDEITSDAVNMFYSITQIATKK